MLGFARTDGRLTVNLLAMNIRDRYLGSSLGSVWAIANPLFMLVLYTFLFGFVFKVRLPGAETTFAYALWLISGYGPWLGTVEALTAATHSVVGASGIVKNLAIKTELLPIAATFVGSLTAVLSACSCCGCPQLWPCISRFSWRLGCGWARRTCSFAISDWRCQTC